MIKLWSSSCWSRVDVKDFSFKVNVQCNVEHPNTTRQTQSIKWQQGCKNGQKDFSLFVSRKSEGLVATSTANHKQKVNKNTWLAVMKEVTSRHMESSHFNVDYSQMPAVAQQW